jgi:hypothetical protein
VQLPAEADQRAGGPVDVPDPLQQPAPAAQRPAVARCPIACSTSARRSAWQRLNARCPSLSRSSVERFPERPPAEHGLWIRDLPSNTSDDPQQPASAGRRRGMPDGQLSAATIEFEDIGEPEDHGPQQA